MLSRSKLIILTAIISLFFTQCGSKGGGGSCDKAANNATGDATRVKMFSLSDPTSINPYNAQGEQRTYMGYQVYQSLLGMSFKNYDLLPTLAVARPTFSDAGNGLTRMSWEIRPEAVWDNGDPITGEDVAFSLKVIRAPKSDNQHLKPYFEYIKDIQIDPNNPKKFDLIVEPYMTAEITIGSQNIIPRYVYDEDNLLGKYKLKDMMLASKDELSNDPVLDEFAQNFNSERFKRKEMVGSGPYKFDRWETNQRQVFKLKEDWWGHQLKDENEMFVANPKELIYETITDKKTAVVALKGEKIDAMRSIVPKDFVDDLRKNDCFLSKFNTYTPPLFSYDYIGLNLRNPMFENVKTRQALAHLMNVNQLIESFCFGLGEPVTGTIHPSITKYINADLSPIKYNLEEAKRLLKEAGWGDENGNGILDKEIDDELVEFKFAINYNNGNNRRKTACLIFQEGCRKAGIEVSVEVLEWANLLETLKKHKFDAYVGGWVSSPVLNDPTQIWHTSSYNGGSNYVGFGNEKSDALIEKLRVELDEAKRIELFKEFQQLIRDEMPYIFLLSQKERIATSKKYMNAEGSGLAPGYWMNSFAPIESM